MSQRPSALVKDRVPARAAGSLANPLTRALLVLTFTTGLVDATCYLGLGRVFAANMTGTVVLLGFGVAGRGGFPVVALLISLASFLLGGGAGGVLAARVGDRKPGHVARALAIEVSLIGIAAVVAAAVTVRPNAASADIVIALLAFAMGARNATVRHLGVPDLTTTVLTMTLTGLASDAPVLGGSGAGSLRRIAAVLAMFAGALAGAELLKSSLTLPLVAAGALALATWLIYVPAARRSGKTSD